MIRGDTRRRRREVGRSEFTELRPGGEAQAAQPYPGEDLLAAIALGKTVAFLLWSVPTLAIVTIAFLATDLGKVPDPWGSVLFGAAFLATEAVLLWLVIRGGLPGTSAERTQPFSEKQLAIGCHVLALGAWALAAGMQAEILRWVVAGFLALGALVYFVTKSVISRRPRWTVLSVLAVPALQVIVELALRRSSS
jgi:hypothetical protein